MQINFVSPFQIDTGIHRAHAVTVGRGSGFLIDEGAQFGATAVPACPPAPPMIETLAETLPEGGNQEIEDTESPATQDFGPFLHMDASILLPDKLLRDNFSHFDKSGPSGSETDTEGTIAVRAAIEQSDIAEAAPTTEPDIKTEALHIGTISSSTAGVVAASTTADPTNKAPPSYRSVDRSSWETPVRRVDANWGHTDLTLRVDPTASSRTSDLNSLPDPYDDGGLFDAPAPHRTFDSTVGDPLFGSVVPGIGVSDEPMHAHPGIIAGTVPNPEANEDVEAMTPSSEDPRSRFDVRRSGALANSEPSVPVPAPDEAEAGLLRGDGSLAAAVQLKTDAGFHLPATNVPALSLSSNNETHPFVMQYGWRGSVIQQTKVDGTLALHQAADAPGSVERKGVANVPRADGGSSTFETLTPAPNKDSIFALMPAQSLLSTSLHGPAASTVAPYQVPQTIVEFVQRGAGDPVELLLRPDELGRLKFEMTTGGERVHVTLFVERPESMDLIRRYSDQLLQDLRQSGFSQPSLSFGDWSQRGSKPEHITLSPSALEPKAADVEATLLLSSAGSDVATGRLDLRL